VLLLELPVLELPVLELPEALAGFAPEAAPVEAVSPFFAPSPGLVRLSVR
jgi:hypothetical protein